MIEAFFVRDEKCHAQYSSPVLITSAVNTGCS